MSKRTPNSQDEPRRNSALADQPHDGEESAWAPTYKAARQILEGFASLRLTVALFAMAIFIVLAGTLGQVHRDIWDVIHDYFRMNAESELSFTWTIPALGTELIFPSPLTWIDLNIFFPPAFFAGGEAPDLSKASSPARLLSSMVMAFGWSALIWLIPFRDRKLQFSIFAGLGVTLSLVTASLGGFWFPKGWTIGAFMAVNLLSAHLIRFKIQSSGPRLWAGVGVIALGILATCGVIMSGSNKEGVLKENYLGGMELEWSTIWIFFEMVLAALVVLGGYAYAALWRRTLQDPDQSAAGRAAHVPLRRIVGFSTLALAGLLVFLIQGGDEVRLNDSGMRILWQLLKATVAGLILLGGCILVFRKRAGVVVLHAGVALIMLSELLVGVAAVEGQMSIIEGQSSNYVQDIRSIELAIVDPDDPEGERHVVIPKRFLVEGNTIEDDRLPFDIRVDTFYKNSNVQEIAKLDDDVDNPADSGAGRRWFATPARAGTGTDAGGKVDLASAYVTLFSKEDGKHLGTWLMTQHLIPQDIELDGKTYQMALRFKRTYKPYTITLKDARQENYLGTNTPKDFRSIIDLKDPSRNEDRKDVHIWMNNPLRFGGETFYQQNFYTIRPGLDGTTLQVVTNDGWMIPYVACMIVAVGMLAHFLVTLMRFLNRDSKTRAAAFATGDEDDEPSPGRSQTKKHRPPVAQNLLDPIQEPTKNAWLTPVLSGVLILVFGGYLASKARIPKPSPEGYDFYQAGQIPVAYEGRVKPLDTVARNSLRILSNRQEFTDQAGDKQPALRWLLDLIANREASDEHRVIRIDYQPLLDALKLTKREGYLYSFKEIAQEAEEFQRQVSLASDVEEDDRSTYQKKVLELAKKLQLRTNLDKAFAHQEIEGQDALLELIVASLGHERISSEQSTLPLLSSQATGEWELYNTISLRSQIALLAQEHNADSPRELAKKVVAEYEVPLAAFAVRRQRMAVSRTAQNQHQSFAQAAREFASQADDDNLKAVYEKLAEASPRQNAEQLAADLPSEVVENVARQEALGFMSRIFEQVPRELLMDITGAVRSRLAEADPGQEGDRALLFLEVFAETLINKALDGEPMEKFAVDADFDRIFTAYAAKDAEKFNAAVAEYQASLAENPPKDNEMPVSLDKIRFESFFGNAAPFYYLAAVYLFAGLLAAASWLTHSQPLNQATFWLLSFSLIVHTAALIGRIYISGRPPVTNLYSSAVFIGWGCVLLGLVFERFYRIGIGNIASAAAGFLTLGIAHLLTTEVANFRGDDFTVMQAVLDTQFWLATHVVCISMGYAATYMAGLLGVAYIIGGVFTPMMTAYVRKEVLRMLYGTVCFAIFFSFVGTVLGGLWADDSWGRFWGWDTKENGALIIVLWNALVLHARWGGIVKDRGLAVLAVAGNIAVSWSWFGVNELGIGLHSYGFTEGVLPNLALFCVSQLMLIAIGSLPKDYWWSHIAEKGQADA